MANHSPLPWTAIRSTLGDAAINEIRDADGYEVNARGFGLSGSDRSAANSDLMFRAVNAHEDLFVALKLVTDDLEKALRARGFHNDLHVVMARAALAKAEA